jgi:hypothetical protein
MTFNPYRVPSVDAEARTEAIRIVDQRHGYTMEFAPDPLAHSQEYEEEERKLFDPARREPICEHCVAIMNIEREHMGLEPWEVFSDSYGTVEDIADTY